MLVTYGERNPKLTGGRKTFMMGLLCLSEALPGAPVACLKCKLGKLESSGAGATVAEMLKGLLIISGLLSKPLASVLSD